MAAKGLGATSARNTAVSTPMGTPSKIASVVPTIEVRITHRIPNFGSAAVGIHSVLNRISFNPTFKIAGVPLMIIYKVMETTASTAKKAQIVKTICATVSSYRSVFSVSHYGSVCLTIHRFFLFLDSETYFTVIRPTSEAICCPSSPSTKSNHACTRSFCSEIFTLGSHYEGSA